MEESKEVRRLEDVLEEAWNEWEKMALRIPNEELAKINEDLAQIAESTVTIEALLEKPLEGVRPLLEKLTQRLTNYLQQRKGNDEEKARLLLFLYAHLIYDLEEVLKDDLATALEPAGAAPRAQSHNEHLPPAEADAEEGEQPHKKEARTNPEENEEIVNRQAAVARFKLFATAVAQVYNDLSKK